MAQNRAAGLSLTVLEDREVLFDFQGDGLIDRATGTFVGSWHSGGLEPAGSTWSLTRNVDSSDTPLTGGQTVTSYTAGAVTSTCELLPGSPAADYIEWPETSVQDGVHYRFHTSAVARGYIARVHKFQDDIVGIMVSRERAKHVIADRSTTTDPSARSVTSTWTNGDDEVMMEEMFYHIGEGGDVTQVEAKRFVTVADLQAQVDAGTAFKATAANDDLTAFVPVQGDDGVIEFDEPEGGDEAGAEGN